MLDIFAKEVPFVEVAGFRVLEPSFLLLRAIPESRDGLITHCETETALFSDRIGVAEATSAAPGVEDRALDLTRLLQPNEGRLPAGDVPRCRLLICRLEMLFAHRFDHLWARSPTV